LAKAVEVFVHFKKVPAVADHSSFAANHAACKGIFYKEESYSQYKTKKALTERSQKMMEEAIQKARELNVKLRVYDLSTLKGKLIARLNGVDSATWRIRE